MADLLLIVGKLAVAGTPTHSGTAWLLTPRFALTAAHCVGNRTTRELYPGPFTAAFPDKVVGVDVVRTDFRLDIALLALQDEVPGDLLPLQALPRPANLKEGLLAWNGYGFPQAHSTGLGLHGTIALRNGNVDGVPALQLQCEEGGLGGLEGISGSPVCVAGSIVGLIRFGPPQLYQKVLHASDIGDIAKMFPEVAERLTRAAQGGGSSGGTAAGAATYTRVQIYVVLIMLTPIQYTSLLFHLNPPHAYLAPNTQPLAEQAMSLIRYYETQPLGVQPIISHLEQYYSHLLQKVQQET